MHAALKWAEFVPVAPLLPTLAELAGYFVAFGLCIIALYFVKALFATAEKGVGWIPWLGKKLDGGLKAIEQRMTGTLGSWVASMDHRMALAWYKLAHTAEWIGHEIAANAGVLADLANLLANPNSIAAWRKVIGDVHTTISGVRSSIAGRVHAITQPITARVARLERWTYPRVHRLAHAIDVTIPGEFAGLRTRARKIEDGYTRVWNRLGKLEARFASGAFAGAVVAALAFLGLSWLRCNNVKSTGQRLCGMDPSLLEALLADSLLIAGSLSLVEFAREMVGVTDTAVRPITTFWRAS